MMVGSNATQPMRISSALFGDTDIAGGIPDAFRPQASSGPVYFEGKLIVALSFQGADPLPDSAAAIKGMTGGNSEDTPEQLQGVWQLWDCLSDSWLDDGPLLMRFETYDVVLMEGVPIWRGIVETRYDARLVPGWDRACSAINDSCYLRWRQR